MLGYFYSGLPWKPKPQISLGFCLSLSISVTNSRKTNAWFSYSLSMDYKHQMCIPLVSPNLLSILCPPLCRCSCMWAGPSLQLLAGLSSVSLVAAGRGQGKWQVSISPLQPLLRLHRLAFPDGVHILACCPCSGSGKGSFPLLGGLGTWGYIMPVLYHITIYLSNFRQVI